MKKNNVLVFVPMYNEADNVFLLYEKIKNLPSDLDILFLDDNSPDGTGKIIEKLQKQDGQVATIHRPGKMGLGSAHIEGFRFARENNYDYLLTMDADFTHDPRYIPDMLKSKDESDLVIGSRYVSGGDIEKWGISRRCLTFTAHFLIKYGLGLTYDCTTAFRLYRVSALSPSVYLRIKSEGYSFFFESIYRLKQQGLVISEVPIIAPIRTRGASKISKVEIFKAVLKLLGLFFDRVKRGYYRINWTKES